MYVRKSEVRCGERDAGGVVGRGWRGDHAHEDVEPDPTVLRDERGRRGGVREEWMIMKLAMR